MQEIIRGFSYFASNRNNVLYVKKCERLLTGDWAVSYSIRYIKKNVVCFNLVLYILVLDYWVGLGGRGMIQIQAVFTKTYPLNLFYVSLCLESKVLKH